MAYIKVTLGEKEKAAYDIEQHWYYDHRARRATLSRSVDAMVNEDLRRVDSDGGDMREYGDERGDGSEVFHGFETARRR